MKKFIYGFLFLILCFCSRGPYFSNNVPPEFNQYLSEFKNEAEKRNHTLEIPKRFKIKLVNKLGDGSKGFCVDDNPMIIRIERGFWEQADQRQQKILFFHELGHCLLDRKHDNAVLPNGEWKSLMRGGELPEGRDYYVNFLGFRKEYYLDELFDTNTDAPDWALLNIDFEKSIFTKNKKILEEDFQKNTQNWRELKSDSLSQMIQDGVYYIRNKSTQQTANTSKLINLNLYSDFEIKALFDAKFVNKNNGVGFFIGHQNSLEYISFSPEWGLKLGNISDFRPYTTIPDSAIRSGGNFSVTLRKIGSKLFYFLNEKMVYHIEPDFLNQDSSYVGFFAEPGTRLIIDQLDVHTSNKEQ